MANKRKNSRKKNKINFGSLILPVVFILFGVFLIFYSISRNFNFSMTADPEQKVQVVKEETAARKIKTINIAKIGKNLPVEDGSFVNGRWEVSQSGVSYYTDSSLPDEGGNTVLYGHNKVGVLGGLAGVRPGDRIELTLEDDNVLNYEVAGTKTIKPTEVEILNQTDNDQLTIYTCTGFLDSARFVVVAKKV